jgi:N-acetylglucosaminyldiphosphoundecaprenol N-acetyl-beta-D-mannosaminyltransferase
MAGDINGRATVLDCQIDRVDLDEALTRCETAIESRVFVQHMAINAAKLVAMRDDARLRQSVAQCELVTADGQAVVWASRLLSDALPERVTGIDLMERLLARAAEKGYRVYVLGAKREVLECAVNRIRSDFPDLELAGYRDGYYDDADEPDVAETIKAAHPDILFVAMSSPRKEFFLATYRDRLQVPFVMGVGGAIDIFAGLRRRAPGFAQRLGFEWLFRMVQEPRRLGRRYLSTNLRFIMLVLREVLFARPRHDPLEGLLAVTEPSAARPLIGIEDPGQWP